MYEFRWMANKEHINDLIKSTWIFTRKFVLGICQMMKCITVALIQAECILPSLRIGPTERHHPTKCIWWSLSPTAAWIFANIVFTLHAQQPKHFDSSCILDPFNLINGFAKRQPFSLTAFSYFLLSFFSHSKFELMS